MSRLMSCPWQKVVKTERNIGNFSDNDPVIKINTTVSFGICLPNCPFYDAIGNYCRRINKHESM